MGAPFGRADRRSVSGCVTVTIRRLVPLAVLLLTLLEMADAADAASVASLNPEDVQLQAFYGLNLGANTTQEPSTGPALRSVLLFGDEAPESAADSGAECNAAFAGNLEQLVSDLQTNFTEDPTLGYLNLVLPLQLATASLCRQLLINGFDPELLQICFTQVPTLDGESANLVLELESRGFVPAEFACSEGTKCQPQNLGCGACDDNSTQIFLSSLATLLDLRLCSPEEPRNINSDFACIYSTVLMTQANLSRDYLALTLASPSVNFIAMDVVELYKDNAIHSWIADRELVCPKQLTPVR